MTWPWPAFFFIYQFLSAKVSQNDFSVLSIKAWWSISIFLQHNLSVYIQTICSSIHHSQIETIYICFSIQKNIINQSIKRKNINGSSVLVFLPVLSANLSVYFSLCIIIQTLLSQIYGRKWQFILHWLPLITVEKGDREQFWWDGFWDYLILDLFVI